MDARNSDHVEPQRASQILRSALLEIRRLCRKGEAAQAAALADAVHNLPVLMVSGQVMSERLRADLVTYQNKYAGRKLFDYVDMLDKGEKD